MRRRQNEKAGDARSPALGKMARPERFELPTTKFVAWYSIQLSYGRMKLLCTNPHGAFSARLPWRAGSARTRCDPTHRASSGRTTNRATGASSNRRMTFRGRAMNRRLFRVTGKASMKTGGERGIRTLDQAFDPILP